MIDMPVSKYVKPYDLAEYTDGRLDGMTFQELHATKDHIKAVAVSINAQLARAKPRRHLKGHERFEYEAWKSNANKALASHLELRARVLDQLRKRFPLGDQNSGDGSKARLSTKNSLLRLVKAIKTYDFPDDDELQDAITQAEEALDYQQRAHGFKTGAAT